MQRAPGGHLRRAKSSRRPVATHTASSPRGRSRIGPQCLSGNQVSPGSPAPQCINQLHLSMHVDQPEALRALGANLTAGTTGLPGARRRHGRRARAWVACRSAAATDAAASSRSRHQSTGWGVSSCSAGHAVKR